MVSHCVAKKAPGRSKEEIQSEKKQELEKRLQDVSGHLNSGKKETKTCMYLMCLCCNGVLFILFCGFSMHYLFSAARKNNAAEEMGEISRLSETSSSSDSESDSSTSDSSSSLNSDSEPG